MRRMIARRCIYGIDPNSIAVQLSRLSVWIHTFVPGLPLSLLDHNLIHGNALIGIGSFDEIRDKFEEAEETLFKVDADALLGEAAEPLLKLAKLSDATLKDISVGRDLMEEAENKTAETKALCDLIVAQPVTNDHRLKGFPFEDWEQRRHTVLDSPELRTARDLLRPMKATHLPIVFPEVYLGNAGGFHVILGNPPWEEAVVTEDKFWARHKPGLASLLAREQELEKDKLRESRPDLVSELHSELEAAELLRRFLHSGNFPGMGTGDPDLYKAFAWRFWFASSRDFGRLGVVLPRSALAAKGSETFRKELFLSAEHINITTLQNSGRWIFDMEARYTIALIGASKSASGNEPEIFEGPVHFYGRLQ